MTFEELQQKRFVEHHKCGACGAPVGFSIHPEMAAAVFNSGCECSGRDSFRLISHKELEELK